MRTERRSALSSLVSLGAALVALSVCTVAHAWVLQVPAGAEAITIPDGRVLCGAAPEGFTSDASRRHLRARADAAPGTGGEVQLAATVAACGTPAVSTSTVIVTGPHPTFDPAGVTLSIDAASLELRGDDLDGARVSWTADGKTASDVCSEVGKDKGRETCTLAIDHGLPADPRRVVLHWMAAGGVSGPDVVIYDAHGRQLSEEQTRLPIARMVLHRMFQASHTLNVQSGEGRIEVEHPEAVSSIDCEGARCELGPGGGKVTAIRAATSTLAVRVRLLPHVFFARGDNLQPALTESLSVVRCPLFVASGDPLRDTDDTQLLVRLDPSCGGRGGSLRWTLNGDPVTVQRSETLSDGVYVLLWAGRITADRAEIVASRADDNSVLAVASLRTVPPPPLETSLSLPGFGEIDFIPKNRDAMLSISHAPGADKLVPVSVPGAYTVTSDEHGFHVRGVYATGGYTALRFAYRIKQVPSSFDGVDFARLVDPVQRPIREASVPAPIGGSSVTDKPVVELFCIDKKHRLVTIPSGLSEHIPFDRRDSCRLVVHRERIPEDSGEQRLNLDVTVNQVGGDERSEAHLSQQLSLRHADQQDVVWIRGAKQQFDRITIHITHVVEQGFLGAAGKRLELPSAQWTIITEDADFKFYATAAIPASLYRFSSDPGDLGTGPLALNFGVLSRLTWLDSDGHEGLAGLEAGVMGMGLATDRDRTLALVAGFGIAIPIGNPNQVSQAAINIHAWAAYSVGDRKAPLLDDKGAFKREVTLNPWAFVFGPSITIGSVGVFM